jgi:RIP metalloprotease RseP
LASARSFKKRRPSTGAQSNGSDRSFSLFGMGVVAVLFVHELGHLLVARHYGIRVLSLSVGFGPQLINFNDRFGTRWNLRAFPLGGSCMISDDNKVTPKCLRQRAAIHAAGPIFNLIFAALFGLAAPALYIILYSSKIGWLTC